jgi:deazaflavin-dependent oxidoreductase (nitroreductase family)
MSFANVFVRLLLRSPFHGVMSGSTLLLTYMGRKSGKRYTIPVSYLRAGDIVTVLSFRSRVWWKQLQADRSVMVEIQRRRFAGVATVITDDQDAIVASLRAHLAAHPSLAKGYHIPLNAAGDPDPEAIRQVAHGLALIQMHIALA